MIDFAAAAHALFATLGSPAQGLRRALEARGPHRNRAVPLCSRAPPPLSVVPHRTQQAVCVLLERLYPSYPLQPTPPLPPWPPIRGAHYAAIYSTLFKMQPQGLFHISPPGHQKRDPSAQHQTLHTLSKKAPSPPLKIGASLAAAGAPKKSFRGWGGKKRRVCRRWLPSFIYTHKTVETSKVASPQNSVVKCFYITPPCCFASE
jgi:hypothetical protein